MCIFACYKQLDFLSKLCNTSKANPSKIISVGEITDIVHPHIQSYTEDILLNGYIPLISNLWVVELA